MLLGPALFFYAFATMSPQNSLPMRSYFIALTGPLIVILGMIPFIFSITSEQKLALANPATRDPELFKIALTTCLFSMLSFIVFTGVYLVFSFKLQRNHRIQLMERFSDIEKRSMDWFRSVLILWGCVWFLFTLEYGFNFIGFKWFGAGVVFPIFEALILMTFIHFSLKQKVLTESDKGKPQIKQVRSALLSTDQMEAIAKKLVSAMQNETLYLEEDLSLKRLSDAISVSENHISETLSQQLNTNFFQFVNKFRVEQAMMLLTSTNKTVTVIAYESGFYSKSTFNTAFKKVAGKTPTLYRNEAA